jgi:hypothetical protein
MLRKASLVVSGLFLSLLASAPATAQSRSPGEAEAACHIEASFESGEVVRLRGTANRFCNVPGGVAILGGRLAHAIMFVDLMPHISAEAMPASAPADLPRPDGLRHAALPRLQPPPAFAGPVVER